MAPVFLFQALNVTLVWIILGLLGLTFPKVALLKTSPPTLGAAVRELCFSRSGGLNVHLLYYIAPAAAFVLLYSILPHKVNRVRQLLTVTVIDIPLSIHP